jgi:hypothetical protein
MIPEMAAQRMKHQTITPERYDDVSLLRIGIAICLDELPICLLSFGTSFATKAIFSNFPDMTFTKDLAAGMLRKQGSRD